MLAPASLLASQSIYITAALGGGVELQHWLLPLLPTCIVDPYKLLTHLYCCRCSANTAAAVPWFQLNPPPPVCLPPLSLQVMEGVMVAAPALLLFSSS